MEIAVTLRRIIPWRISYQAVLLISIIGIMFILPFCLGCAEKIKTNKKSVITVGRIKKTHGFFIFEPEYHYILPSEQTILIEFQKAVILVEKMS